MLPLVEDAVLQSNPEFAALHNILATAILNPDGSTKTDQADKSDKDKARDREKTFEVRIDSAKNYLLSQALSAAAPPPDKPASESKPSIRPRGGGGRVPVHSALPQSAEDVSPELAEILLTLPSVMHLWRESETNGGVSSNDESSPITADTMMLIVSSLVSLGLMDHLSELASFSSENLAASAQGLARVANPSTNPSYVHRAVPQLPGQAAKLQRDIIDATTRLAAARQATATASISLLEKQTTIVTLLLRALEAKHGPIARSLELRASEVALDAQTNLAETQRVSDTARQAVYTPQVATALENYQNHLRDSKVRLQEAIRERKALLQEYGVSEEGADDEEDLAKGMREMATAYSQMGKQVQDIKGDLARLNKR